jgi:hypothetical protein
MPAEVLAPFGGLFRARDVRGPSITRLNAARHCSHPGSVCGKPGGQAHFSKVRFDTIARFSAEK